MSKVTIPNIIHAKEEALFFTTQRLQVQLEILQGNVASINLHLTQRLNSYIVEALKEANLSEKTPNLTKEAINRIRRLPDLISKELLEMPCSSTWKRPEGKTSRVIGAYMTPEELSTYIHTMMNHYSPTKTFTRIVNRIQNEIASIKSIPLINTKKRGKIVPVSRFKKALDEFREENGVGKSRGNRPHITLTTYYRGIRENEYVDSRNGTPSILSYLDKAKWEKMIINSYENATERGATVGEIYVSVDIYNSGSNFTFQFPVLVTPDNDHVQTMRDALNV